MATTYTLTATLYEQAGAPIVGATVSALLDRTDSQPDAGFISPELIEAVTDADGIAKLQLWPNALGVAGSRYLVRAADAAGEALLRVWISMPAADAALSQIAEPAAPLHPYPPQDVEREDRLVGDITALLHDSNADTAAKVRRWLDLIVRDAARRRRWWFLTNTATTVLRPGCDVIDLRGHVEKVVALYAGTRLRKVPLSALVGRRQQALAAKANNAGPVTSYALEAGRRIHTWPAPGQDTPFTVIYARPMAVEIVPDDWEPLLIDGVLGRYGRHFDRAALTEDPAAFEARYERALNAAAAESHDLDTEYHWSDTPPPQRLGADSGMGAATSLLAPASLTGIGYESIETGDYPQRVR